MQHLIVHQKINVLHILCIEQHSVFHPNTFIDSFHSKHEKTSFVAPVLVPCRLSIRILSLYRLRSIPVQKVRNRNVVFSSNHSATVFMMHGLGDTAHGWSGLGAPEQWGQNLPHVKFVFPNAPTVNKDKQASSKMFL